MAGAEECGRSEQEPRRIFFFWLTYEQYVMFLYTCISNLIAVERVI